jgi:GTPase
VRRLRYKGPVFSHLGAGARGLQPLVESIWHHVAAQQRVAPLPDLRFDTAS